LFGKITKFHTAHLFDPTLPYPEAASFFHRLPGECKPDSRLRLFLDKLQTDRLESLDHIFRPAVGAGDNIASLHIKFQLNITITEFAPTGAKFFFIPLVPLAHAHTSSCTKPGQNHYNYRTAATGTLPLIRHPWFIVMPWNN
jgi:hypothetical protein